MSEKEQADARRWATTSHPSLPVLGTELVAPGWPPLDDGVVPD